MWRRREETDMDHDTSGGTKIVEFSTIDRRIGQTFTENVSSSVLARYLEKAVREHAGTLMVARLIAGALAPFLAKYKGHVGPEDVERLSVHDLDDEIMGKVSLALAMIEPEYINREHELLVSFGYQTVEPVDGSPIEECKRMEMLVVPRGGISPDPRDHEIYAHIFICALAMLCGVKVNPRESVEVTCAAAGG